ncbi:hypothetical protein C7974DRAFT_438693 [Boeremia exigua]|uniref:uncharacterized protein n=1 Tax=Boeremia exigua TaxID=749465 RepID=UPI001E8DDCB7|nr:uncharacterized protein C7974DRAFT_438693 [Boeremia exigua]KAH6643716.1 hypothetical protein C7974DRAFT_438693 [Boeremia exigua]
MHGARQSSPSGVTARDCRQTRSAYIAYKCLSACRSDTLRLQSNGEAHVHHYPASESRYWMRNPFLPAAKSKPTTALRAPSPSLSFFAFPTPKAAYPGPNGKTAAKQDASLVCPVCSHTLPPPPHSPDTPSPPSSTPPQDPARPKAPLHSSHPAQPSKPSKPSKPSHPHPHPHPYPQPAVQVRAQAQAQAQAQVLACAPCTARFLQREAQERVCVGGLTRFPALLEGGGGGGGEAREWRGLRGGKRGRKQGRVGKVLGL